MEENKHFVDRANLPADWPTHLHAAEFWEELGRAIATFGFLEDQLTRAIFALSGTRSIDPTRPVEQQVKEWVASLEMRLSDSLGSLIGHFERQIACDIRLEASRYTTLIEQLRDAKRIRDILCHGTWDKPDKNGASLPRFFDRKLRYPETRIDIAFLVQTRREVVQLVCDIVDIVTQFGFQFPGTRGPGAEIYSKG